MLNFDYCKPTYFAFGKETETQAGTLVRKFGGSKTLLVYGGGSIKKNGLFDAVTKSLSEAGVDYIELGGVQPNPKSGKVYEGIDICRKEDIDFVLAVGGGSAIDVAKAVAVGALYEGDIWDFFGHRKDADIGLPIGTVLSIAAAGSEASRNSVITHEDTLQKWGAHGEAFVPKFSILNPEYTESLPAYQTASGITDIIAHVLERYFTDTDDVELTDCLCEAIVRAVITEAPKVIKDPHDYNARANIMWAGVLAHNDTCGVGRTQDWGSHALSHQLSALFDTAHGAGLAIVFPVWMNYNKGRNIDRFTRFATRMLGVKPDGKKPEEIVDEGIARFKEFLAAIGMPQTLGEIGVSESDIPKIVEHAKVDGKISIGNCFPLTEKDVAEIYRMAL